MPLKRKNRSLLIKRNEGKLVQVHDFPTFLKKKGNNIHDFLFIFLDNLGFLKKYPPPEKNEFAPRGTNSFLSGETHGGKE